MKQGNRREVLEQGRIYFLYRPAVEAGVPRGVVDLQRFYLVLHPADREERRLVVVGQKKLPEAADGAQKYWAFVDSVSEDAEALAAALGRHERDGENGGGTAQPGARPAGEGHYVLYEHGGHTHLSYRLDEPGRPGEVQQALHIAPQGSYVVSLKNPAASTPPGIGLDAERKAEFPKELQARFGDRRFLPLPAAEFLDTPGAELLLIGTGEQDTEFVAACEFGEDADVFADLGLERSDVTIEPLEEGKWA